MPRFAFLALTITLAPSVGASDFMLDHPIDCTLGQTCYIQNYVDRDPGPGMTDYQCGGLGYDGHKGTDFGLPSLADMERGVNVLAAAPGVVQGMRDGVPDIGPTGATAGKECGNGVVLRHDGGWETQYCHMKYGSVSVKTGQRVDAGAILGQVGLSGKTQFPHLHLSVRHNGKVTDPFDVSAISACGESGGTLWQDAPAYHASGLLQSGFSTTVPKYKAIKAGGADQSPLAATAPALVFWAYAYGGQKGDIVTLTVDGPNGRVVDHKTSLSKDQAQFFRAAGKRLKTAEWPTGDYLGVATLTRNGAEYARFEQAMTIR